MNATGEPIEAEGRIHALYSLVKHLVTQLERVEDEKRELKRRLAVAREESELYAELDYQRGRLALAQLHNGVPGAFESLALNLEKAFWKQA